MTTTITSPATTPTEGLTREAVEALASHRGEPAWLRELRLEAFAAYERLPLEELAVGNWRSARLRGLDLQRQRAVSSGNLALSAIEPDEGLAGVLAQTNGETTAAWLEPGLEQRGVRLLDLGRAVNDAELGPRVRSVLGQVVSATEDKLTALHYAFLNGGVVVYVPRNVVIEQPLLVSHEYTEDGLAAFPHVLVIAEDGAQVAVLDRYASTARGGAPLASGVVEVVAGGNAQVRYVQTQEWSHDLWGFSTQRARLAQAAHLRSLNVALGGRQVRNTVLVALEGKLAQADLLGVVDGRGRQHVDFQTLQDHFGEATRSDLVIHNALRDQSSANFTGLIRINKDARQTESSQEQMNVLLSPKAKADSDPKLEILNNDVVRCTHGAAVGPLDREMIFYLQTRGLSEQEAESLVLEGFFRTVLLRLEAPELQERVWAMVQARSRTEG